jgi:hypothetical protein
MVSQSTRLLTVCGRRADACAEEIALGMPHHPHSSESRLSAVVMN